MPNQNLVISSAKRREFGLYVNSGNSAIGFLLFLGDSTIVLSLKALSGFLEMYPFSGGSNYFLNIFSQSIVSKNGCAFSSA